MGQTLADAELNAAARKQAKPELPAPREQIEITVTFLVPAGPDEDLGEAGNRFLRQLPGDMLTSGSTYGVRRECWFLVKTLHRVGRKAGTWFDYRRPDSPRR